MTFGALMTSLYSLICTSPCGSSPKPCDGKDHNILDHVVAMSVLMFFFPSARISISVREMVIMRRKLAAPSLAEERPIVKKITLFHRLSSSWKSSDWDLPKGSAHFGQNAPPSLDDNAAKSLLDAITNCPSGTLCCCQQQLP